MMMLSKEEVEAQGKRFTEPTVGVPIKKRPINLNGPYSHQSDSHSLDKCYLTPTPKSPLDLASPCYSNGSNNKIESNVVKPFEFKNNNLELETAQGTITPTLQISPQTSFLNLEKSNHFSTDLSLTGNTSSSSSKSQNIESLNCLGRKFALDLNVDLNVSAETWDSTADFAVENCRVEPVQQPLAKQGSVNNGCNGNVLTNLSKNMDKLSSEKSSLGDVTLDLQLKLPSRPELRMKSSEVWSSDLSLSLSGKDLDTIGTPKSTNSKSQLVGSNSLKNLESSVSNVNAKPAVQKEIIVKTELVEANLKEKSLQGNGLQGNGLQGNGLQENGLKDQDNSASNSLLVKKEPVDNHINQECRLLGGKLSEKSSNNNKGIDLNRSALGMMSSNPVVTKTVPVEFVTQPSFTQSNTSVPVGSVVQPAIAKSNLSVPVSSVVQPSIERSNMSVPVGLVSRPCIKQSNTSVPVGSVVQPAITKSIISIPVGGLAAQPCTIAMNISRSASSLVPNSLPLVGSSSNHSSMEDIKPKTPSLSVPAVPVNNANRTVPMTSEGMSQGSADMDCSEENHNLPKLASTSDITRDMLVNSQINEKNVDESSSSVLSKIPKLEPGVEAHATINTGKEVEDSKSVMIPSNIPNSNESNSGHNNNNIINNESCDKNGVVGDKNEITTPSSCSNLRPMNILALSNKLKQSLEMDKDFSSKSMSPIDSGKRDNATSDRENGLERENCAEREIGSSSRQFVGGEGSNCQFNRRFKRNNNDYGFDRPFFERKKSRISQWNADGSMNYPIRGNGWGGGRYNKFESDRIEDYNGDAGTRPGSNNRTRPNLRFNNSFNNRNKSFRYTRQNNNDDSDLPFPDEGNEGRRRPGPRPCLSRFQSRRETDEMDGPVFGHPNNNHFHNKRVDQNIMCTRERSFSPVVRRNTRHWTPPGDMLTGHNGIVTRVDRSPGPPNRRPYYNKNSMNRRPNNRPLNRNNSRRFAGPTSDEHFEPVHFEPAHFHHVRYGSDNDDDDVAYSDGVGAQHGTGRNRPNNNNNANGIRRQAGGDQDEFRYNNNNINNNDSTNNINTNNNRGGHRGWRDGNNNANNNNDEGDKIKRRRY